MLRPALTVPASLSTFPASINIGETEVVVMETPCHTKGHVLYCVTNGKGRALSDAEAVFSGDTVFIGGVGAFFHGNARDMETNLNKRMAALPDSALLFCGHEYSVDNLRFAAWLEPDSVDVIGRFLLASAKRNTGEPTVPSLIGAARGASLPAVGAPSLPAQRLSSPSSPGFLPDGVSLAPCPFSSGWERRTNPYFRGRDAKLKKAVLARAEWLDRRRKLSYVERAFNAVRGRGFDRTRLQAERRRKAGGKVEPPRPSVSEEDVSPVVVYEKLQARRACLYDPCVVLCFCRCLSAALACFHFSRCMCSSLDRFSHSPQLLLSSGAWQGFKLGAGAAAAARMRAASQLFPVGGAPAAPGMSAPYRPPQPPPAAPAQQPAQGMQLQVQPPTGAQPVAGGSSVETREAVAALLGAAAMGSL